MESFLLWQGTSGARVHQASQVAVQGREEGLRVLKALFYLLVSSNESVARLARRFFRLPA
jgi:hypothetical protein